MLLLLLACPPKKTPDSAVDTGVDTGEPVLHSWVGSEVVGEPAIRGQAQDRLDRALQTPAGLLLAAPQRADGVGRVCLDSWEGTCWEGPHVGSYFGTSLAWVGEPAVGAFQDWTRGQWAGAVYLLDTEAVLLGEPGDFAGILMATSPETLAVSAYGADTTEVDGGLVYLVRDAADGGDLLDRPLAYGSDPGGQFGLGLAWGDVDGDGEPDLLAGAPGATGASLGTGAAFVFRGPVEQTTRDLDADHTLRGQATGDQTGKALAAGDIDGDGVDEWAAGSPGIGRVQVLSGGEVLATLEGTEEGRLGFSVALLDVDGDGRADLLAGATREGEGGQVLLVYGPFEGELSGDLQLLAEGEGDKLGIALGPTDSGFWVGASQVGDDEGAVYLLSAP